jgi:two-component system nitrogen regulation response regulator NtrX
MSAHILIVDDQDDIRMLIQGILNDENYTTQEAGDSQTAVKIMAEKMPDAIVLDIWLENSEMDGMDLLKKLVKSHPGVPVIMISGHGSIETAVSAIQFGAYDFIEKPFNADKLLVIMKRALEAGRLRRENQELRLRALGGMAELHGSSSLIQQVRQSIERVAPTSSRVLITGSPGTGKDIAARMIHNHSKRAHKNYVVLNCAILSPERIELELFGSEGAAGRKPGVLEQANGGTLFLDEVADMPLETQAKIVRVLQDQYFTRLGGSEMVDVDVRVIAATNQNLAELMERGKFRQDLYYRLNIVPIELPSLRDRTGDIPTLADYFMHQAALAANTAPRAFADDAVALMQSYNWPGNVRQLRNVIEWLLIMAEGEADEPITANMMPPDLKQKVAAMVHGQGVVELMSKPLREAREIFEREYLLSQMNRFGGNISRTAVFIGMERSALHRKLKAVGLQANEKEQDVG